MLQKIRYLKQIFFLFLETWSVNVLMCLSLKHFGSLNKPDSNTKHFSSFMFLVYFFMLLTTIQCSEYFYFNVYI